MSKILKILKRCKRKAQSLVEYGLILALVSVVAIAVLNNFGQTWKTTVNTLTTRIQQANTIAQNS